MFHTLSSTQTLEKLTSHQDNGLSSSEVQKRLQEYGANELPEEKKTHWLIKLLGNFKDTLMLILFAAAIFSIAVGEYKDGIVILIIIVANAIMGFVQEAKADNAIAALKKLSVAHAKVIRDRKTTTISARELVPGDIIIIENGDKIPADARLIEAVHLKVSESSLTGESKPIDKTAEHVGEENIALGDRINMVYKDTVVMFGRGKAIVTGTGMQTEIGKIFKLLQKQEGVVTALTHELNRVGKGLTIFALISGAIIFVSIAFTNSHIKEAVLTAISMAIAVVPEGIPAVITTVLAISVARLAKKNAIIRKMEAVETLGSATYILTDKTGTLTKNEMTVTDIHFKDRKVKVTDRAFIEQEQTIDPKQIPELAWLLTCSVLCNDATIAENGKPVGDPTESSLVAAAQKAGFNVPQLRSDYRRIFEIPFSSVTKRMTVVVEDQRGDRFAITKGAVEAVSPTIKNLPSHAPGISEQLSEDGIRNLMYSFKQISPETKLVLENEAELLKDQEYAGIIGKKDPLRPEVKDAVGLAANAGVKTIMITGDHKLIARNIGKELGVIAHDHEIMDGTELEKIGDEAVHSTLDTVRAFSRVSPEQKLKIVSAAMKRGETVIVTGDGVNDAPAIKTADIGVAMGISGTDVAKEAADVVLQDDNYSTIVEAIKQGRAIFNNFIKFLKYQISCNLSGVLIVFPITILGFSSPLFPVHILLLNLISETGPSIALGLETPDKMIMSTKPRRKTDRLLTRERWMRIIFEAVLLAGVGIAAFFITRRIDATAATTAVMATAFLSRLWHAFSSRSETLSIFSKNLPTNRGLYITVLGTLLFLVAALYTSVGNEVIKTVPLSLNLFMMCLGLSVVPVVGVEVLKMVRRK